MVRGFTVSARFRPLERALRLMRLVVRSVDHPPMVRTHRVGHERHVQCLNAEGRHGEDSAHGDQHAEARDPSDLGADRPGAAGFTMTSQLRRCCR